MAKLKTYTQEDLARSYAPLSSTGVGAKGSQSNPYTESEMNEMIDNGTWTGGFVVGLGYVAAEHTVTHPSSGSASDWHCPNCGLPYPTDGTMKCSNCGTALSYNSGSSSGGGGGGGTSTEEIEISSNGLLDPNNPKSIQILGGTIGDLNNLKEFMKTLPVQFVDYLNTLGLKLILKINDYHIDSDGKKMPHGTYTNSNNTITVTDSDSYELLYHEFVHAVQDDLNIASTDFAIGNSNLEYEAYIMGQFIKDMYAIEDKEILKLYFDSEGLVALDIKANADILKEESFLDVSSFSRTINPYYESSFLPHYSTPGEFYIEKLSSKYNDPNWQWNWEKYIEKLGISTTPKKQ